MHSIRIFAKNMGDPYYEPTIVVHDDIISTTFLIILLVLGCITRPLLLLLGPRHIQPSTYTNVTAPPVRLLGGEGTIPKSSQYVTVVTDITQ